MGPASTFSYKNSKGITYYLHTQEVKLKSSGKTQKIFYFAKVEKDGFTLPEVPTGYVVKENTKTGLPFLKKA